MQIRSGSLILTAAEDTHLRTEMASAHELGGLLGALMPADWPPGEYDRQAQEYFLDKITNGAAGAVGWFGWYAQTVGDEAAVVGAGGFIGPPDANGLVMLGFSVAEEHRGKGYATEMAQALVGWALAQDGVSAIEARTTPGNAASRRVLEKCGFRLTDGQGEADEVAYCIRR